MQKWIIFIIIFLIVVLGVFIVLNIDIETEYVPETEVEETELRKTIVTLYFENINSGELSKETRMIDSKELLKNPYKTLLEMLFSGPENANYKNEIPSGTTILDTSFNNGCVTINLSKEFNENVTQEQINEARLAIYKTLTELTEVNSIKILIDGCELENVSNEINKETYLNFSTVISEEVIDKETDIVQTSGENDEAVLVVE